MRMNRTTRSSFIYNASARVRMCPKRRSKQGELERTNFEGFVSATTAAADGHASVTAANGLDWRENSLRQ